MMTKIHKPWRPQDLITWSQQLPGLQDDPEKVVQVIRGIFRFYDPTWVDVQMLLDALFTPDERYAILAANRCWADQGVAGDGQTPWPAADPGWEYNGDADHQILQQARQGIEESIRVAGQETANWSKVRECLQQPDKHPSVFLARLSKRVRIYGGGIDPEAEAHRPLMVSTFVEQSAPDIKKYFSKHVPDWPGKTMEEIVHLAVFVYNNREEERAKNKKLQKKEQVSLLAAALCEGIGASQGRGGAEGEGEGGIPE